MVIVHVISGDSPLVHITWKNGRVRIMVLNLQARKLTCSSQTHCKGLLVHEQSLIIESGLLQQAGLLIHCVGHLSNIDDSPCLAD